MIEVFNESFAKGAGFTTGALAVIYLAVALYGWTGGMYS